LLCCGRKRQVATVAAVLEKIGIRPGVPSRDIEGASRNIDRGYPGFAQSGNDLGQIIDRVALYARVDLLIELVATQAIADQESVATGLPDATDHLRREQHPIFPPLVRSSIRMRRHELLRQK